MNSVTISFDPAQVDRDRVYGWLSNEAYWSTGLPRDVFERAVANSLVASAIADGEQVAFARVITDRASYAWLCDVFVATHARGRGVGRRLIGAIINIRLRGCAAGRCVPAMLTGCTATSVSRNWTSRNAAWSGTIPTFM
jgi:GNAT superfamily N-acetyltransferase